MKKFLLLAFAACLTFAAQAVVVNWTGTGEHYIATSQTSASLVFMVTDINRTAAQTNFATVWTKDVESGWQTDFGYNNNTPMIWNNAGGTVYAQNTPANATSILFAITFEVKDNSVVMNTWLNGEKLVSYTWNNDPNNGYTVQFYNNNNLTYNLDSISVYDRALTADEIATLVKNQTTELPTVPEPTALALLALGVAGLALRRKMA